MFVAVKRLLRLASTPTSSMLQRNIAAVRENGKRRCVEGRMLPKISLLSPYYMYITLQYVILKWTPIEYDILKSNFIDKVIK